MAVESGNTYPITIQALWTVGDIQLEPKVPGNNFAGVKDGCKIVVETVVMKVVWEENPKQYQADSTEDAWRKFGEDWVGGYGYHRVSERRRLGCGGWRVPTGTLDSNRVIIGESGDPGRRPG